LDEYREILKSHFLGSPGLKWPKYLKFVKHYSSVRQKIKANRLVWKELNICSVHAKTVPDFIAVSIIYKIIFPRHILIFEKSPAFIFV